MLLPASSLQKSVLNLNPLSLLPLDEPLSGGRDLHLRLVCHKGRQRTAEDGDGGHDHPDGPGPDDVIDVDGEGDDVDEGVGQNEDGGDDGGADRNHFGALRSLAG